MNYIEQFYTDNNEAERFKTRHNSVEFLTTKHYLHRYLWWRGAKVIEIGAGTGAYSLDFARNGYTITAVDLLDKHVTAIKDAAYKEHLDIDVRQGDATCLGDIDSDAFDATLLFGPMYHLYDTRSQLLALREARRITKPDGIVMIAYCLQDATIFNYIFKEHRGELYKDKINYEDFSVQNTPDEVFNLYRLKDIDSLEEDVELNRLERVATDGLTNYAKAAIDEMTKDEFNLYMKYHLATCTRPELIGASHHLLDICRKEVI